MKKGMGAVIVAVWTGWAVAVLVGPILKHAEQEGMTGDGGVLPSALESTGGGPLVSVPVHLPFRRKRSASTKMDKIVRNLADMYSMHCNCSEVADCSCAEEAKKRVSEALDNAVEREFSPPSMYYRSKDGYSFRLRGFQKEKTHMNGGLKHDKFLNLKPIPTQWRVPRAAASTPAHNPRLPPIAGDKLQPIKVQQRFVTGMNVDTFSKSQTDTYSKSHFVRRAADDRVVAYPPGHATSSAADKDFFLKKGFEKAWVEGKDSPLKSGFDGAWEAVRTKVRKGIIAKLQKDLRRGLPQDKKDQETLAAMDPENAGAGAIATKNLFQALEGLNEDYKAGLTKPELRMIAEKLDPRHTGMVTKRDIAHALLPPAHALANHLARGSPRAYARSMPAQLLAQKQRTTQLWETRPGPTFWKLAPPDVIPLADEEFPGKHPTLFEQQADVDGMIDALAGLCKAQEAAEAAAAPDTAAAGKDAEEDAIATIQAEEAARAHAAASKRDTASMQMLVAPSSAGEEALDACKELTKVCGMLDEEGHDLLWMPGACKELAEEAAEQEGAKEEEEEDVIDALLVSEEFKDYSNFIWQYLADEGALEKAKAASAIPLENNAAFTMPHQEGEEADYADWLYATEEDAVRYVSVSAPVSAPCVITLARKTDRQGGREGGREGERETDGAQKDIRTKCSKHILLHVHYSFRHYIFCPSSILRFFLSTSFSSPSSSGLRFVN
jgi:hypothetical protein